MLSVSQNSLYLISGSVIKKLLGFIYFILLARFFGPENLGKYAFAISFTAIFPVFIDLGLNHVLIRYVSQDRTKIKDYFYNTLIIKLICSIIIYGIIILIVNLLGYPSITKNLVYLVAVAVIIDSCFTNTIYSILRGLQNLKYESIGLVLYQLVILATGIPILYFRLPLIYIMLPLIFGSIFYFVYGLIFLFKKYQIKFDWAFNSVVAKQLIKTTVPFFWAGLFGTVFSYIDVILLSKLGGDKFVGFYSAANKLENGFRIIPIAFAAALYPAACFYFTQNKDVLKRIMEKAIFYSILLSLPMIIGLWALADQVIIILYGLKFIEAIPSFRILVWGILFVFLDYIFFANLNACGGEKKNVYNRGLAMLSIIVLNILFTPTLKHVGAAIAFVFSFSLLAILGGWMSYQYVRYSIKNILLSFLQILIMSLIMGAVVLLLKSIVPFIPLILIGAVVYFVSLWIIGLINKEDIRNLKSLIGFVRLHR